MTRLWRSMASRLPEVLRPIFWWSVDRWARSYVRRYREQEFLSIPPKQLRHRVHGVYDVDSFLKVGKKCLFSLENALARAHRSLSSCARVLDFGCGCGRIARWLEVYGPSLHLYGTDIDAEAIAWCRDHLTFAEFHANGPLPPLDYPPETFDLIYAISVFAHLNEELQFQWLDELRRIIQPGGIVLVTLHGRHLWRHHRPELVAQIKEEGFLFTKTDDWKGIFPEWYQISYHTRDYVTTRYSRVFNVLHYIPRGMNGHQDVVILQPR